MVSWMQCFVLACFALPLYNTQIILETLAEAPRATMYATFLHNIWTITGSRLSDSRFPWLATQAFTGAHLRDFPLVSFLPGIIASKRCNNVRIFDNTVYDGGEAAAGIFLHRSSDSAEVYGKSLHNRKKRMEYPTSTYLCICNIYRTTR